MEAIDELAGALRRRLIERARAGESGGDIGGEIAALVEREAAALSEAERATLHERVLREIAECESGGNPRAVSSNGLYRGKFQFSRETWKAVGGRGSDPAKASEAHQDRMALRLYRQSGVAPWPACGSQATS